MSSHVARQALAHRSPAVTPDDEADLPGGRAFGLYIGAAGNLKYKDGTGTDVGPTAVVAGVFPCEVTRVYATGTTATGILALYTKGG